MKQIYLFRESAPGDAGGGAGGNGNGVGPSLADIMNQDDPPALQEGLEADGITLKPGYQRNSITGAVAKDPNYKEPNPGSKPPAPPATPPGGQPEGVNPDGTLKDGYMRDATDNVIKDPNYKDPKQVIVPPPVTEKEAVNDKGELNPGFIKNPDGTYAIDPDYEEVVEDEDGSKFIEAVEAITGRKYDIKYPEGVLPGTPEGIAHRENVIRESAAVDFELYLQRTDPRAYAYFLHRQAGGTDDNFMGDQKGFQLPDQAAMKASADIQTQVYTQDLLVKGLDAGTAKILVDAAVKDNTLGTKADAAWALLDKTQKDQLKDLQADSEKSEKLFNDNLATLSAKIVQSMKTEMGFVVPEAQQPAFQKYIIDNLRYDNGNFFIVQPVGDNLKISLEALFFQFCKGDLKALVTKQAKTEAAQTLRLKLKKPGITPGGGTGDGNNNTKNLPLSAILPSAGQ